MSEQPDKPVSTDAADDFREHYKIKSLEEAREIESQLDQLWAQPNPWHDDYYSNPQKFYWAGHEVVNRFLSGRYKPLESPQKPESFAGGGNKLGARQDGVFWAVSCTPDVCKTPIGAATPPIPYVIVSDLAKATGVSKNVRFNKKPVYILNQSVVPSCTGDEAGVAKGVISGTVGGETKPTRGSSTVKVNGQPVIRDGDPCTMNSGNCTGFYVTVPPPGASVNTNGSIKGDTNPQPTLAQLTKLGKWVGRQQMGFYKGEALGIWDLAKGTVQMAMGAVKLGPASAAVEALSKATGWYNYQGFSQTQETIKNTLKTVYEQPKALIDALTHSYVEAWKRGAYGEALGRGTVDIGTFAIGGAGFAGKVGKGAEIADEISEGANATARVSEALDRLAEAKLGEEGANAAGDGVGSVAKSATETASARDAKTGRAGDGLRVAGKSSAGISTHTEPIGKNTVTWTMDASGRPLSVSGILREFFSGSKRASKEVQAQNAAAKRGITGDQGGHLAGHRFVRAQGEKNLFPQNGDFNNSAFKVLENDYERYIKKGYEVHFTHTLGGFDPVTGRPGTVNVEFEVIDPENGKVIKSFSNTFSNKSGQVYTRQAY